MHNNAAGNDDAKLPPCIGSMARWELWMAIAAARSHVAAKDHGGELKVHGDAVFIYSSCCCSGEIFLIFVDS